jgi:hypothetical protein
VALKIGLGWGTAIYAGIGINKRQILALLFGKAGLDRTASVVRRLTRFAIHLCPTQPGENQMNVRYRVELNHAEREELTVLLSGGKHRVRRLKRAQILLAADAGVSDEAIAAAAAVSGSTIYRTNRRFVEGNLEAALSDAPRPGAERKLTGKEEALLVATACSTPPVHASDM